MNYKKWADQYFAQADLINNHIKSLKLQLKVKDAPEGNNLNYRISLLYKMYLELVHTAKKLRLCERRNHNE